MTRLKLNKDHKPRAWGVLTWRGVTESGERLVVGSRKRDWRVMPKGAVPSFASWAEIRNKGDYVPPELPSRLEAKYVDSFARCVAVRMESCVHFCSGLVPTSYEQGWEDGRCCCEGVMMARTRAISPVLSRCLIFIQSLLVVGRAVKQPAFSCATTVMTDSTHVRRLTHDGRGEDEDVGQVCCHVPLEEEKV